ncbi:DUF1015 domain-containing protein [Enterococcus gallinarum]|uniref:DUF1015 domain-containing protein n=1 Tax=Enterococcus gallinarum TaxID=1353 RepID=UPI001558E444|nr:DUF1015 family protein [Enterococcus gallinarum]NQE02602.1 DUF1015 domain-containing protein [Enterococcus gallinarum]
MVQVFPFKAIRPQTDLAEKIAELPYDVVNTQEAAAYAAGNPYSYFHIDRSEIDLPNIAPYDPQVYAKAAENLAAFREKNWLIQDNAPSYYLYELTMAGRSQTGLVVCTSIEDYVAGKIKKHEFTRPEKEVDRINHIQACDANTSPIFLSYRQPESLKKTIQDWQSHHQPIYDFTSYHEVHHRVWLIDDSAAIAALSQEFSAIDALYIADGHHRTESAVKVGLQKRKEKDNSEESERFLAILFPENELAIWEYNRVVNVPIPDHFFDHLAEKFHIEKPTSSKPSQKGTFYLYLGHEWFSLTIKEAGNDAVESLDVSLLQKNILAPLLGIEDVRTDKRIDFVGGIRGPEELERMVDSGEWTMAFLMYPTQMKDLLAVADANEIMPPKSTWFEPKLLSGLFLHDLETKS